MTPWIDALQFLSAPFVMCLILAGIHCYLGIHVLTRGVIFVDLSLAQVAAFGSTAAFLWGWERGSSGAYFIALGATILASALFALSRRYEDKISPEALIGIVYAFGAAAVIVLSDRIPHGAEHVKALLVGDILWVTWHDVLKTLAIYSGVGVIHYLFRRQFFQCSGNDATLSHKSWWDFLFYALFGVVITSSVSLAGVLQVFCYLIVPSVMGSLFFNSVRAKLSFGWIFGLVVSFAALALSYVADLPSGATIVVVFTVIPILTVLTLPLLRGR